MKLRDWCFAVWIVALPCVGQTVVPEGVGKEAAGILRQKCLGCHGKDPVAGQLDLRSREAALKGGQHGAAIVLGKGEESRLYRHLTGQQQPQMPLGGRLSEAEIAVMKRWIESGAPWDGNLKGEISGERKFSEQQKRFWAFQDVKKPAVPGGKAGNAVDAFVLAQLQAKKVKPNGRADKATLLRRATIDLTGLPPTPEEVQAFVADGSADAFAKVVDRLLASPRYGERWGRHWLDVARYADTDGFKSDDTRPNIWRYRDYVIQAFNEDKPYDRFIKEQIAGDELYPNDKMARVAVGFNRHFTDENNQPVIELRRQETLTDITDTVGSVFLGMTYGCARCHDHKFDPILHKDYYRLQAFFANVREDDHLNLLSGEKLAEYERQYAVWDEKTKEIRKEMRALVDPAWKAKADFYSERFSKGTQEALLTPEEKRTPLQALLARKAMPQISYREKDLVRQLKPEQRARYQELEGELKKFEGIKPADPPEAQTMVDNGPVAPRSYVLTVGNWDAPREEVQPGFLSILDPSDAKITPRPEIGSTGRRSALANWLADGKNPLTARVMVNRIWHYHFGRGIVGSTSDFGMMGERPTNQGLLDYLAATFVENGWSVKKMHRLIMLSNVYQQSSAYREEAAAVDPENRLLWRYERHRAEGEVIRDSMLSVAGKLNLKAGGPGVYPAIPPGAVPARYGGWKTEKDAGEADRRSVYVFVKRNMLYPMFDAFDAPNPQESCSRRFRTVIPLQSLVMMNDSLVQDWSKAMAGRVLNDGGLTDEQLIDRAYRLALSRAPKASERDTVLRFLDEQSKHLAARLAKNEKVPLPEKMPAGMDAARGAAFVDFCQTLLNSNEFLYLN